jgi:hypothetical protein
VFSDVLSVFSDVFIWHKQDIQNAAASSQVNSFFC